MQSRITFIECAGNSGALNAPQAQPLGIAAIHGLLGCSERTGVKVSTLLDEAGIDPSARWVIAEGADAAGMSRSIRLAKIVNDALLCLYQNGEAVRLSNGYPVRLLVPGFEGNMNVKWLRRLKLTSGPAMTKDETSKYTILLKDEKAGQFVFPMEVKSVITRPAPGITLKGPGFYEISGLAWSGNGSILQVEVSADGGQSWAPAALQGPILPKAPVRFRAPWQWNGGPAVLQSRATDDTGTRLHPCLLLGFLSARSLFSSRYDCIESYRSRRVLLSDGIIERSPDPDHGRKSLVKLTARGRRLRDVISAAAHDVQKVASKCLTTAELEEFYRLVDLMTENLSAERRG
jgi:sulfite dehydrogenase